MSVINLKNEKLREYVKNFFSVNTYGEPFDTLLVEVFLRHQYVLDLTPEQFYEDLVNFKNSVNSIVFEKVENVRYAAVHKPYEKQIAFNFDYWQNIANMYPPEIYYKKLFETFSHECEHGMQDENGYNRAGGYNYYIGNRAHAIYEICTQAIAAKMTHDRERNEFYTNNVLTGDGYADEIFAVPLIAAAFGVSEQDVLKYGVRKREELISVLNKNIGNYELTEDFISNIENYLECIHSVNYPDDTQIQYKNLSSKQKKYYITESMKGLVTVAQNVLISRIQNASLDFDENQAVQFKYDQKKIYDTLDYEFAHYGCELSSNYISFIIAMDSSGNAEYIKEALNVFSKIAKDTTGILKNNAPYIINAVKNGNFQYCEEYGIQMLNESAVTCSLVDRAYRFKDDKQKLDYNNFKQWDNSGIFQVLSNSQIPIQQTEKNKPKLNTWEFLYTDEGMRKINDLQFSITENKKKYGLESKDLLLDFLEADINDKEWHSKLTRTNNARNIFLRSFNSDQDKEFLAKLVAEKYVQNAFDDLGNLKEQNTIKEKQVQSFMASTYLKHGKYQLVMAISQMLINDDYQYFSGEDNRINLAVYGKKLLFEVISQPLIDELLNQRDISPQKDIALKEAIYSMERKYPGTSEKVISKIIEIYKQHKVIAVGFIPQEACEDFNKAFQTEKSVEDLIGILCNEYSKNYINNRESSSNYSLAYNSYFNFIIERDGPDKFRESMIKGLLKNDFSDFKNFETEQYMMQATEECLIKDLSVPYIQKVQTLKCIEEWNAYNNRNLGVTLADIKTVAKKERFSVFNKFLGKLLENKRDKEMSNTIFDYNEPK